LRARIAQLEGEVHQERDERREILREYLKLAAQSTRLLLAHASAVEHPAPVHDGNATVHDGER